MVKHQGLYYSLKYVIFHVVTLKPVLGPKIKRLQSAEYLLLVKG